MSNLKSMSLDQIETILDYRFENRELLMEALSHSSLKVSPDIKSNDKLSFLGDSILYARTTLILIDRYPDASREELNDYRKDIICNSYLAKICEDNHLTDFMITGKSRDGQPHSTDMMARMIEAIVGAIWTENEEYACSFIDKLICSSQFFKNESNGGSC